MKNDKQNLILFFIFVQKKNLFSFTLFPLFYDLFPSKSFISSELSDLEELIYDYKWIQTNDVYLHIQLNYESIMYHDLISKEAAVKIKMRILRFCKIVDISEALFYEYIEYRPWDEDDYIWPWEQQNNDKKTMTKKQ